MLYIALLHTALLVPTLSTGATLLESNSTAVLAFVTSCTGAKQARHDKCRRPSGALGWMQASAAACVPL